MARQLNCNQPVFFPVMAQGRGWGCSLCLTPPPPPCQDSPGTAMASDPSLPTLESRLSRGESTMGLGRWSGPCREWSGPRVQDREMWGATHCRWQKCLLLLCQLSAWHPSPGPIPQTQPADLPGAEATIFCFCSVSSC